MNDADAEREVTRKAASPPRWQPPLWLALVVGLVALALDELVFPLAAPLPDGVEEV